MNQIPNGRGMKTLNVLTWTHKLMRCCEGHTCPLCQAKYVASAVGEAHENGKSRLAVDCTVKDPSVTQTDRTVVSKIYPLLQSALGGVPVFVGNLSYLSAVVRCAKAVGLELCSGTLQKRAPEALEKRVKAAGPYGIPLKKLESADLAKANDLVDAFVCRTSKAVFPRAAVASANLTVADVLLQTSKLFIYQHGGLDAASAADTPRQTPMGGGDPNVDGMDWGISLRRGIYGGDNNLNGPS